MFLPLERSGTLTNSIESSNCIFRRVLFTSCITHLHLMVVVVHYSKIQIVNTKFEPLLNFLDFSTTTTNNFLLSLLISHTLPRQLFLDTQWRFSTSRNPDTRNLVTTPTDRGRSHLFFSLRHCGGKLYAFPVFHCSSSSRSLTLTYRTLFRLSKASQLHIHHFPSDGRSATVPSPQHI